jgi:predicted ATP-grasp superfamily ATP-dependent carboligase
LNDYAPAVVLSHGPGGLGAVRSLARRGVRVTVISYDATDPALRSRYPAERFCLQGDSGEQKELHLLTLLRNLPERNAVILTTSDQMVSFISARQDELLKKFRFRLPPPDVLDALNDKRKETELVRSLGFAVPKTLHSVPADVDDLARELRFPIIFKPHLFSVAHIFPLKNAVVTNRGELDAFYAKWKKALPVLLAQEVIPGPDDASWICSGTFDEQHRMLDCGIKQKLRALPAHFGGSTLAVSRHNDSILELAEKIGNRLEYVGHAGIEFRWDERDGDYKYIELNPRLPANVGFDEACGLATVWNSYLVSQGLNGERPVRRQKDGVCYLDLKGDLRSAQDDGMSKGKFLREVFGLWLFNRTNGPYFAWDDPIPGIAVAWRFFRNYLRPPSKDAADGPSAANRKAA